MPCSWTWVGERKISTIFRDVSNIVQEITEYDWVDDKNAEHVFPSHKLWGSTSCRQIRHDTLNGSNEVKI